MICVNLLSVEAEAAALRSIRRADQRKYDASEKGKAKKRRHAQSEKGKATSRAKDRRRKKRLYSEMTEEQRTRRRASGRKFGKSAKGLAKQRRRKYSEAERARRRARQKAYAVSPGRKAHLARPENRVKQAAWAAGWAASVRGRATKRLATYKRRAGGVVTRADAERILRTTVCYYCGVGIQCMSLGRHRRHACMTTIDHVLPIVRGGTNDLHNLVAACFDCNKRKYTMTAEAFMRSSKQYR